MKFTPIRSPPDLYLYLYQKNDPSFRIRLLTGRTHSSISRANHVRYPVPSAGGLSLGWPH